MCESGSRHVCRAAAATAVSLHLLMEGFPLIERKKLEREEKNGKKRNEEREQKPDARYLRTRIFYIGRDS